MGTNFKPNYAIHPGEFLKDEMEAMNISQKFLAASIAVPKSVISEIIHGKRRINGELAVKFETVLYSIASYWLNLQSIYDEAIARQRLGIGVSDIKISSIELQFCEIPLTDSTVDYYKNLNNYYIEKEAA